MKGSEFMKKVFAMLLLISVGVCMLTGCDLLGHYYSVTVTGSSDVLYKKPLPIYRAGDEVEIRTHILMDAGTYVYVNGEEINGEFNEDFDCWSFRFIMPEEDVVIHITHDQFYGKDEYSFKELYWFANDNVEDRVTEICIERYDRTSENGFVVKEYSSDQKDIDRFLTLFDQVMIKVDEPIGDTVSSTSYIFIADGSPYAQVGFVDGYLWWNDFSSYQIFKFKDESYSLPFIEEPEKVLYSFKYDGRSSDVKRYDDDTFSLRYTMIGEVEFAPYEGEEIDIDSPFYLDSRYGKINLLTSTVFELNGGYYEIINNSAYWAYNYLDLNNK